MSVCLGYSVYDSKPCESIEKCNATIGCREYSTVPLPETNFNLGHEKDYPQARGLQRQSNATGSWPCRGQSICNYFDKENPLISEYVRAMDVMALPPN